jgi:hypothetical protein
MTNIYSQLKNGIKGLFIAGFLFGVIGSCAKRCESKLPTQYADATPEIRAVYAMHYNSFNGLYLNVDESWKKIDRLWARRINFYDYGFDGNLDRVTISQDFRKKSIITNRAELAEWQPFFEQMRKRRFGDYNPAKDL